MNNECRCSVKIRGTAVCPLVGDRAQAVNECRDISKAQPYRKTANMSRALVGNIIIGYSDAVGASPVGAAPTTSSFST